MTKIRLLIRIASITIITVFLMACITAGVIILIDNYAPAPIREKLFYCYDFGQDLYAAVRYYCWTAPPTDSWVECNKVKYVLRYLRKEKVKRIAFGRVDKGDEETLTENWDDGIIEPERIKLVLQLISTAKKELSIVYPYWGRMVIVTDKHKFIIPIDFGYQTIKGLDWTSEELSRKLWEWGYGPENTYELPSKEQTVAILIYHPEFRYYMIENPLVVFGNKTLAEEILFRVGFDKTGKSIMNEKYEQ